MHAAKTAPASIVLPVTLTPEQLRTYKEEGFVLIKGLIPAEAVQALNHEVMDIMARIGLPFTKLKQTIEYLEDSHLDGLVNNPNLKSIADQVMEGPSSVYLPFTAVKSGGGGGRFHFHQDNQYTRHDAPSCNLWMALAPMTPENGCLQIVPRSHLKGTLESMVSGDGDDHRKVLFEPSDFVHVVMEPGDCVAFTRLTVHGSGQNVTEDPRVAYAVQFHRNDTRWLDRETNTWKLLLDEPRFKVGPVKEISVPKGKTDGH